MSASRPFFPLTIARSSSLYRPTLLLPSNKKSFNLEKYEKETELSKFVWRLKRSNVNYSISWSILKRAPVFSSGGKRCGLCLKEKLYIMNADPGTLLNKRSEVFVKCRHREKWWAAKFKRARVREPGQNNAIKQQMV